LRARLEAALQISVPRAEPWVALSNPVDLDGRIVEGTRNRMVMVLVGLQSDPAFRSVLPPTNPAAAPRVAPPLHLDALVMLMANFSGSEYATGLGMLSRTVSFFHENPVLILDPMPGQPPDTVMLDFVNLDLAQTNELMAMLDLKYLPSALYRMRGLAFTSEAP
jgi:Pvc16 N-terminal domain